MCTDIFNKKFQTPNLGATFKRQRSYYVRKNKETLLLVDDSQGGCKHLSWQGFELHSEDVYVRLARIGSRLAKTEPQVLVFVLTGFLEIFCFHFLS